MRFQPQNYAADFLQGMQAVSGMRNQERSMALAERKAAEDSARADSAEQRAISAENRAVEESRIKLEKAQIGIDEERIAAEARKRLRAEMLNPVQVTDGDLPKDPAKAALYGTAHARVAAGVKWLGDAVTQSGRDIMLTAKDIKDLPPEMQGPVGSTLESYNVLTDPQRVGRTFTEPDSGRSYTTRFVGGVLATKKGTVVPLYYATYDDNPAEGKYVPSTVNASNAGDDLMDERRITDIVHRSSRLAKVLPEAAQAGVKTEAEMQAFLTDKRDEEFENALIQLDPVGYRERKLRLEGQEIGNKKAKLELTKAEKAAAEDEAQDYGKAIFTATVTAGGDANKPDWENIKAQAKKYKLDPDQVVEGYRAAQKGEQKEALARKKDEADIDYKKSAAAGNRSMVSTRRSADRLETLERLDSKRSARADIDKSLQSWQRLNADYQKAAAEYTADRSTGSAKLEDEALLRDQVQLVNEAARELSGKYQEYLNRFGEKYAPGAVPAKRPSPGVVSQTPAAAPTTLGKRRPLSAFFKR